jgi:hypothetical protein
MVKAVVLFGSETWAVTEGYDKTGYMGEQNVKDVWTSGRARMIIENKN